MTEVTIVGNLIVNGAVDHCTDCEIPVPNELTHLALSGDTDDWDRLCSRLPEYGLMNPIGKVMIQYLLVDEEQRTFH